MGTYTKTAVLMAALLGLFLLVGRALGGDQGMLAWGAIGLLFNFGAYWFSDRLALVANRARPVPREELPQVYEIVEELTSRAGLPMPRIYLIPSESPNAFATGRNPAHAAVAVTSGILQILDRRELRAVLAHELSHVKNRDILIATIAAAVAGLISAVGSMLRWGVLLGGGGRADRRGSALADLAIAIVAPFVALILQLAISRSREYGADASGGVLSEDPEALASALEKLQMQSRRRPYPFAGPATAHLFIVNPLTGRSLGWLLSTHPPTEERIARLRALAARLHGGDVRGFVDR
ncbi:MAG: protease HtpX [Deltaproteobacteria bacterium]|nr:MAG: protease HtpX [Deltaproteobacteria bacterium]TMB30686.1 MAG: protease HtpX [Deltaproteobacteria bacterium]TMB32881.1 MAG: protease HtpX [Deltaproteobacteria bacterium]